MSREPTSVDCENTCPATWIYKCIRSVGHSGPHHDWTERPWTDKKASKPNRPSHWKAKCGRCHCTKRVHFFSNNGGLLHCGICGKTHCPAFVIAIDETVKLTPEVYEKLSHLCMDIDYPPGPGARKPWKPKP